MKILTLVGVAAVVGIACYVGCSKESRDEAINRLGKAGKAFYTDPIPVANCVRVFIARLKEINAWHIG